MPVWGNMLEPEVMTETNGPNVGREWFQCNSCRFISPERHLFQDDGKMKKCNLILQACHLLKNIQVPICINNINNQV